MMSARLARRQAVSAPIAFTFRRSARRRTTTTTTAADASAAAAVSAITAAAAASTTEAAAAAAAAAGGGDDVSQFLGALGGAAGLIGLALYSVERGSTARATAAADAAKQLLAARDAEVASLRAELSAAEGVKEEAAFYKRRLDESTKAVFKLEKALEIKDGQLDTFINTARRQIRALEDDVRALQRRQSP